MEGGLDKSELREKARKRLEGSGPILERSAEDNVKLIEELRLHQEELNIQNEELRRAQLELEDTRAKYFQLYNLAPVGYITLTPDLIIKEANLVAATLLGSERRKLVHKPLSPFVSTWSQETLYLHYRRLGQGGGKQVHIFSVPGKEGKELQVQFESNLIDEGNEKGFRSILTDITERKRAEEALKESEEHLSALADAAFEGIVISIEGSILEVNKAMLVMLDNGSDDLLGKDFLDLFTPESRGVIMKEFKETGVEPYEAQMVNKNGTIRTVQIRSRAINWGGKSARLGAVQDITELRSARDERDKKTNDLARSNADLQQFAYIASHDLKQPLRMVTSYIELLKKRNKDLLDDKSKEYLHYAEDGAQRMQDMIDDLLTYSRVETMGKPFAPVDMDTALAIVLIDLKVSIEESGTSIIHEPLPTVTADSSQMVLLLENLVDNAIKYRSLAAPQIRISARGMEREWVFAIEDNGIGIDAKHQDRVFQLYQRLHTREEYEGTGIGLALAKRIVERHGGRIWFESEVGKGTTFFFSIPKRSNE
jgi:chemotaxis family two-component system sensor kinase Cph1